MESTAFLLCKEVWKGIIYYQTTYYRIKQHHRAQYLIASITSRLLM